MKRIRLNLRCLAALLLSFAACNDDFMDRVPETSLTVPGFFKTTSDLQSYVNGLYDDGVLLDGGGYVDASSDNVTYYNNGTTTWSVIYGTLSKDNVGGYDGWGSLRAVNLLLNNLNGVSGSPAEIANYAGIGRYFRAWFYINKVMTYSDVIWYNKPLDSDDPDLYKAADPRAMVVDSIIADLEYAAANISATMGNKTRVHKYCALALLSRFCLYEGTYRKYHPELNLATTANTFLQRAVSASEEVMNSSLFEISGGADPLNLGGGMLGSQGYRDLFASLDLAPNTEIIQWKEYRENYNSFSAHNGFFSLTRSLQETYLTSGGQPFSTVTGYDQKNFSEVFVARDPRMTETIAYPGSVQKPGELNYSTPTYGGYSQHKFDGNQPSMLGSGYRGCALYRYGETLLNYAEAKAELGQFGAEDASKSINLLRRRVGMPDFNADREVDETLRSQYPDISDNILLALRRERRVELACEGFRERDLYRWAAGNLFLEPASKQGIYIKEMGPYDVTGDGIADYAILQDPSDKDQYPDLRSYFYLNDGYFTLTEGNKGYFVFDDNIRSFPEPKAYYRPIPIRQTVLNPNLQQPYGWD